MQNSLLDLAEEFLKQNNAEAPFKDIWAYVVKTSGMDEDEIRRSVSRFYTNLLLDGRFVTLGENVWDLRSRQCFDKVHIDMKDVYNEVESERNDDLEEIKDSEYEDGFEEKKESYTDEESDNDNENLDDDNNSSHDDF